MNTRALQMSPMQELMQYKQQQAMMEHLAAQTEGEQFNAEAARAKLPLELQHLQNQDAEQANHMQYLRDMMSQDARFKDMEFGLRKQQDVREAGREPVTLEALRAKTALDKATADRIPVNSAEQDMNNTGSLAYHLAMSGINPALLQRMIAKRHPELMATPDPQEIINIKPELKALQNFHSTH